MPSDCMELVLCLLFDRDGGCVNSEDPRCVPSLVVRVGRFWEGP